MGSTVGETGADWAVRWGGERCPARCEKALLGRGSVADTTPVSLSSPRRACRDILRGEGTKALKGVRPLRTFLGDEGEDSDWGMSMRGRLGLEGPSRGTGVGRKAVDIDKEDEAEAGFWGDQWERMAAVLWRGKCHGVAAECSCESGGILGVAAVSSRMASGWVGPSGCAGTSWQSSASALRFLQELKGRKRAGALSMGRTEARGEMGEER